MKSKTGPGQTYRLVEIAADGSIASEEFMAPDDQKALRRAIRNLSAPFELWRGDVRLASPSPLH